MTTDARFAATTAPPGGPEILADPTDPEQLDALADAIDAARDRQHDRDDAHQMQTGEEPDDLTLYALSKLDDASKALRDAACLIRGHLARLDEVPW